MRIYICILFICLLSCKEKSNVDLKDSDEIYKRVFKIPDNKLTKISIPEFIDLDTIVGDAKIVNITIRNKGQRNLTSFLLNLLVHVIRYQNMIL